MSNGILDTLLVARNSHFHWERMIDRCPPPTPPLPRQTVKERGCFVETWHVFSLQIGSYRATVQSTPRKVTHEVIPFGFLLESKYEFANLTRSFLSATSSSVSSVAANKIRTNGSVDNHKWHWFSLPSDVVILNAQNRVGSDESTCGPPFSTIVLHHKNAW